MKRLLGSAVVGLLMLSGVETVWGAAENPAVTARYLAAFQNPDGGFGGKAGEASSLAATSSAVRTLKNVGGSIPDVLACLKYLKACFDQQSGGFAPVPGGTPDVRTTAVALMAVADMKIATDAMINGALTFFSRNVKTFEDIRIAVAGLESVEKTSDDFPRWIAQVEKDRNPDGTWGQGPGKYRDTGGAAVALLRMGVRLEKKDAVLDALRAGQRPDGAWSKTDAGSDLEATYRNMRAFFMLKETPDLDKLRAFLASCRHSDGGSSSTPGGEADLSGTYYATTILRWVKLLGGEPALVETAGFVPLFNGNDLTGWEGDTSLWSARDGVLLGRSPGIKYNDFLATEREYGDFMLKLTFRLADGTGNSGVQFRSDKLPPHEMIGYQADIGAGYWGCLYDESRRKRVLVQASDAALKELRKTRWNQYELRAMGAKIRLTMNGKMSVDYTETDQAIKREGKIAVQIHAGGPMEVAFKDVWIQPLPRPVEDEGSSPGFHLRTVKTGEKAKDAEGKGERKYSVFLPNGYDGKRSFPVALFLHGSGERGNDGVMSAQVGLGAAIYGHPEDYPLIAVFPQAERTWSAESDDAKAALAALDDVMKTFKVDSSKVILTGLSMGGSGSWSIAAANPERFSAVVPICGRGREENAPILKVLPIWALIGDADRAESVLNTRAIVEALKAAGGKARETEYRGVGHNSWDRAYNDPALIGWMLRAVAAMTSTRALRAGSTLQTLRGNLQEIAVKHPDRCRNRLIAVLGSLALFAMAGTSFAQSPPARVEIKDKAGMFDERVVFGAQQELEHNVSKPFQIPVIIETIEELPSGQTVEELTRRRAEQSGGQGIYVLASRRDHKIDVLVSKAFVGLVPESGRKHIQDAFIAGFKQGDLDKGLTQGVMAIGSILSASKRQANAAEWTGRHPGTAAEGPSTLVLRNQVRLTLAGAERILEGARKKAAEMNVKMNIAVVDDGGHMIAFSRMDGARPASGYTANTKAITAATFRAPTGPVPTGTTTPDTLLNLSLQNAALAGGGKLTTLLGGLPVIVDDQVIGGVGVGGGSGEQDATVARAGVDAFQAALTAPRDGAAAEK